MERASNYTSKKADYDMVTLYILNTLMEFETSRERIYIEFSWLQW